jgi:mannose/cellobiose epimerase-like protein (N-acyl-D-glucosamine 2-epimerase family)
MRDSPAPSLAAATRDLREWATEAALPFWGGAGFDAGSGGFHERLLPDGAPDRSAPRRVLVQARQIYVFAHAAALGWFPEGGRLALTAFGALVERYRAPDGAPGFVHSVTPRGAVDDARRDTYDHAFLLLAMAWLARTSGDAQVRAHIDEVLAFIDENLSAGDGTYHEGLPRSEPRRQNPHMHLFEAMLALHETVAHPQAPARAARLRGLLEERFLSPASGRLIEYFDTAWTPHPPQQAVEPGHHAEWNWLLRRYETLTGRSAGEVADRLLDFAIATADPATGLLPEAAHVDGTSAATTFRCWAQTEFAKALLVRHERQVAGADLLAASTLDNLRRRYLAGPVRGAWFERLGPGGAPISASIPATTLYHLFGAIAEAERVLSEGPKPARAS